MSQGALDLGPSFQHVHLGSISDFVLTLLTFSFSSSKNQCKVCFHVNTKFVTNQNDRMTKTIKQKNFSGNPCTCFTSIISCCLGKTIAKFQMKRLSLPDSIQGFSMYYPCSIVGYFYEALLLWSIVIFDNFLANIFAEIKKEVGGFMLDVVK